MALGRSNQRGRRAQKPCPGRAFVPVPGLGRTSSAGRPTGQAERLWRGQSRGFETEDGDGRAVEGAGFGRTGGRRVHRTPWVAKGLVAVAVVERGKDRVAGPGVVEGETAAGGVGYCDHLTGRSVGETRASSRQGPW